VKRRKARIIKEPKPRGEWGESVFMVRAVEHRLPVSRPWGDSNSFDFVVGNPGHFVSVQVKSTTVRNGGGYVCSVRKNNAKYGRGSFDFLAAYVIPEDVWYIIPAKKLAGRGCVTLCSNSGEANFEEYREAWHLLREAAGSGKCESSEDPLLATATTPFDSAEGDCETSSEANIEQVEQLPTGPAVRRMQNAFDFVRRQLEKGGRMPRP